MAEALFAKRRVFAGAVLALVVVAALLRPVPAHFKFRHGGDAVRYLTWSRVVVQEGFAAFPKLVAEWKTKWVGFPPPTRWIWLAGIAGIMKLWTQPGDEYHPIVYVSWLASVLTLIPLAFWLRRRTDPEVVLLSLLLCATSPLMRGMAVYPLPDSLQLLSSIAILAATAEWLAQPRRWLLFVQALFAFMLVTVRETGLITVIAAYALVLLDRRDHGRWCWQPLVAMFAGCLFALVVTFFVAGGVGAFIDLVKAYIPGALMTTGSMPYVIGPPYRYLVDFLIVAPVVVVTWIASLVPLFGLEKERPLVRQVFWATLVMLALSSLLTKTLRYVLPADVGMRVVCAMAVWALWTRQRRAYAVSLLVALLVMDELLYSFLWRFEQVYDPTTWALARQLFMIPR